MNQAIEVDMQLGHLLNSVEIIDGSLNMTADVSAVCYVAENCSPDSLFVAVKGLQHDGHDFIDQAIARGARFIVVEKKIKLPAGVVAIRVKNSRDALGMLAKNFYHDPSGNLSLVAITGTSGKTTVAYLLESIFKAAGFNCGVLGTVNYRYAEKIFPAPNTTPESYEMHKILREMADAGVTHVITEVSSHAIELRRVDACDFDLGIFTNLTPEHLDYHLTMENYFQAKKRLFAEILPRSKKNILYKMVINGDDAWGKKILSDVSLAALRFGLDKKNDVRADIKDLSLHGIDADIFFNGEKICIKSGLIGKFNAYNILAAAAAARGLRIASEKIKEGIENLKHVPGRLEKVDSALGFNVFVDYAHKADALQQVLENLAQFRKKRIITVFGCGGNRDRGKRPLMGGTATSLSDLTIVTSDNPRREDPLAIIAEIEAGIDRNKTKKIAAANSLNGKGAHYYMVVPERRLAIQTAIDIAQEDDIILIAGKGHEDYQIVGTKKTPFDDRLVAAEALKLRSGK
ncbi:MAG TPA: UDP-N-acetylmuramoyl-L-alanyl-D-glutamate--2,6-diaminopimelate ligase [Smithellaceae bacterium]|nr:UDP-N-acetylmuramoyl-L-alanyl-D-glutamate--2,6-diaminopimelate ligase [Smithellaceae bacterium]HRS89588.1 UDP-N-acetylmuramoyl-L-alanyl-D-glutamate--2,6-diaminopimelate ligase [Smithellaceae bacterium]HRV26351.1 UDP-N-acetylmuramoyl-L-alanyl-D-glutamate--2,6-diaminopimelate ligase [Smithellaceae bacterium]